MPGDSATKPKAVRMGQYESMRAQARGEEPLTPALLAINGFVYSTPAGGKIEA